MAGCEETYLIDGVRLTDAQVTRLADEQRARRGKQSGRQALCLAVPLGDVRIEEMPRTRVRLSVECENADLRERIVGFIRRFAGNDVDLTVNDENITG